MGVGDVVARNDIQYQRYDLVRPTDLAAVLAADARARRADRRTGRRRRSRQPPGYRDEISTGRPRAAARRSRPSWCTRSTIRRAIVRGESARHALMISGDGEGLVDAADVGLLDGAGVDSLLGVVHRTPPRCAPRPARATCSSSPTTTACGRAAGRSVNDNLGYTEQAGESRRAARRPIRRRAARRVPGEQPSALDDDRSTSASSTSSRPRTATRSRTRPRTGRRGRSTAIPTTAWRTQAFGDARGQRIEIDLDGTDHDRPRQPRAAAQRRPQPLRSRTCELTFDGGDPVTIALGRAVAHRGRARRSRSRGARSTRSTIAITQVNDHAPNLFGQADAVGFAEIRPARRARDARRARRRDRADAERPARARSGPASATHPLVLVMVRDAVRPVPPRTQPELSIARASRSRRRARSRSPATRP